MAPETRASSPSRRPLAGAVRVLGELVGTSASFTDGAIRWRSLRGQGERWLSVDREVLGFAAEGGRRIRVRAVVEEIGCSGCSGTRRRKVRRDFVLEMESEDAVACFTEQLGNYIDSLGRPKRLFILLNPYGGKKTARKIFKEEVKPLLDLAGVNYTLQETEYQLHAQEIANKLDFTEYDGVVCVSGDGLLVEVLNGLLRREDWENAIKTPLGIIPAGTGNGMIKSLLDSVGEDYTVMNAVLTVIAGRKCSLDVATISQGQTLFFSVLLLVWGLVADIDIESEKYRWMGSARLDVYSAVRLLNLRRYNGRISFVPAPGYERYGNPNSLKLGSGIEIQACHKEFDQPCGYRGPITSFEDSEWRSLEGPFIVVWLHNVPWASVDAKPAPQAQFSDGCYDLLVVQDCPKLALLSLLLRLSDGRHVESPYVSYLKVKAFRLEPGHQVGNPAKGGIIDADGEVIARGRGTYQSNIREDHMSYGPMEMTIDQALATIFSPLNPHPLM